MIRTIQRRLASLEPRERTLILAGGVFLLCVGIWLGVVEPLRQAGLKADKILPELRQQNAEMMRLADEARELKAKAGQPALTPEISTLIAEATQRGFSPRISETGRGSFDVRLDGVTMPKLAEWLSLLSGNHRLFVNEARLNDAGEGLVSGELVLGQ